MDVMTREWAQLALLALVLVGGFRRLMRRSLAAAEARAPRPISLYERWVYHIVLFDRAGEPVARLTTAQGLHQARARGEAERRAGRCHAYAVLRVDFNSATHRERWQPSTGRGT